MNHVKSLLVFAMWFPQEKLKNKLTRLWLHAIKRNCKICLFHYITEKKNDRTRRDKMTIKYIKSVDKNTSMNDGLTIISDRGRFKGVFIKLYNDSFRECSWNYKMIYVRLRYVQLWVLWINGFPLSLIFTHGSSNRVLKKTIFKNN